MQKKDEPGLDDAIQNVKYPMKALEKTKEFE